MELYQAKTSTMARTSYKGLQRSPGLVCELLYNFQ